LAKANKEPQGKEKEYQRIVGKLMWLLKTRPDCHFAIGLLARFLRSAGDQQIGWAKQLLRYVANEPEKGLMIDPGDKLYLHGGSDSDWGGDDTTCKSTSGGYLALGDIGLVAFFSTIQKKVADSSTAAETYAAHKLIREVIEIVGKLTEMGVEVPLPIHLEQDNEGVIKMSKIQSLMQDPSTTEFHKHSYVEKWKMAW
jgi:hypothetical protein